jgi:hypothetical protein
MFLDPALNPFLSGPNKLARYKAVAKDDASDYAFPNPERKARVG